MWWCVLSDHLLVFETLPPMVYSYEFVFTTIFTKRVDSVAVVILLHCERCLAILDPYSRGFRVSRHSCQPNCNSNGFGIPPVFIDRITTFFSEWSARHFTNKQLHLVRVGRVRFSLLYRLWRCIPGNTRSIAAAFVTVETHSCHIACMWYSVVSCLCAWSEYRFVTHNRAFLTGLFLRLT